MRRLIFFVAFLFAGFSNARAQWAIEESHTTADLRGIHALGNGIAWASGSDGTVLRTIDDGTHWQRCATPPGAEHLDFRGIQAFDASTAIVMSSGQGPLSRLYKTTDACAHWTLLFTNPDPDGFWDDIGFFKGSFDIKNLTILGDPVDHRFVLWETRDGIRWRKDQGLGIKKRISVFAASNSSLLAANPLLAFGTGGQEADFYWLTLVMTGNGISTHYQTTAKWKRAVLPLNSGPSAGVFSLAARKNDTDKYRDMLSDRMVATGGDYEQPDKALGTAAYTADAGAHWLPAQTPPHGFRSAVAYSSATNTWITVGPNGTDISTDDGRNWRALRPGTSEPADADQHWNALSLPFVVGPHGRIGRLNASALTH